MKKKQLEFQKENTSLKIFFLFVLSLIRKYFWLTQCFATSDNRYKGNECSNYALQPCERSHIPKGNYMIRLLFFETKSDGKSVILE